MLQDLVSQSKFLKISLKEQTELEKVINNCERWQNHASSLLQDARCLLDTDDIGDGLSNSLVSKIEQLITSMESAANCGLSLGFDFHEISELQNACSTLHWCKKALSFLSVSPSLEVIICFSIICMTLFYPDFCVRRSCGFFLLLKV